MGIKGNEIEINGKKYVLKGTENTKAETVDGMKYCIVRTFSAGVFAGYLKEINGTNGVVINSRRLWKWSGALTLSELSVYGTTSPGNCKFGCVVETTMLTEIIEVIECTEDSKNSINGVHIWTA